MKFPDRPIQFGATAEREMARLAPTEMVSFAGDRQAMVHLMRGATQVNPVAGDLGNYDCGGASTAMALVGDSASPEGAAQNAEAIRRTVRDMNVTPSAAEKKAIEHLGQGRMSVSDVQNLQVLLYKAGHAFDPSISNGLSPGMVAGLVGMLRERGGLAHSVIDINANEYKVHGTERFANHFTVDIRNSDGHTFANTWRNDGQDRSALVHGQVGDHGEGQHWQGTIHSDPSSQTIDLSIPDATTHKPHMGSFAIGQSPSSTAEMIQRVQKRR